MPSAGLPLLYAVEMVDPGGYAGVSGTLFCQRIPCWRRQSLEPFICRIKRNGLYAAKSICRSQVRHIAPTAAAYRRAGNMNGNASAESGKTRGDVSAI